MSDDDARRRRGTPTFSLVKERYIKKKTRCDTEIYIIITTTTTTTTSSPEKRRSQASKRVRVFELGRRRRNARRRGVGTRRGEQFGWVLVEQRISTSTTNEEGEDEDGTRNEAKAWFYRYLQIAFIVFLITCSIAFAEFIYERLLFEHSEIKEHPHGKTLFIGSGGCCRRVLDDVGGCGSFVVLEGIEIDTCV